MPAIEHEGARIHYEVRGEGPAVLLLQGVGAEGRAWAPQMEGLAANYRCIAIDNRGIGASELLDASRPVTVDQLARDACAVLDAEGVAAAHIVGHSLGGVTAQRLALEHPSRVASLSLLNTFAGGRDLRAPTFRLMWLGTLSRVGTRRGRARAFARLVLPDAYLADVGVDDAIAALEKIFGRSLAEPPAIADVQLAALRAHDERARLAELGSHRTYVASGEHDPIARPAFGEALAAAIPGARYRCWQGTSHALPIQCADAVNAELKAHFAAAA